MKKEKDILGWVINNVMPAISKKKRNLSMPGDTRYQPDDLRPFLGYDQWASWLIIVEWFWMLALAKIGEMPERDAKLLTNERLKRLLERITTTKQDKVEKITKHDILALLELMRKYLPKQLHRWLHYCATSYDIIDTAYALQLHQVFNKVFWPRMKKVDQLWRKQIRKNIGTVQCGRTHLQTALPVTIGFWLANLHNRFVKRGRISKKDALDIEGIFSGAVGTFASQSILLKSLKGEKTLMRMLGLKCAEVSTQIAPPETKAQVYFDMLLLSGTMANLGEDVRILQSSQFGELISPSSSSSAMPHKGANPIAAENDAGMHIDVQAEFFKIAATLVSDLQRDLRWSCVMRSFSAVAVYTYQQLLTTERILKNLKVDKKSCEDNFNKAGKLVVAEPLHLYLQNNGYPATHHFLNKEIVPRAAKSGDNLNAELLKHIEETGDKKLKKLYSKMPKNILSVLMEPKKYIGQAKKIAEREAKNKL